MTSKILLVDDQPIVYEGLKSTIGQAEYFIQGMVSNLQDLANSISSFRPDVLVAESRFNGQDVLGVLERLFHDPQKLRVIIYSASNNPTAIARAAAIQVNDYVLKSEPLSRLVSAIQAALQGREPDPESLLVKTKSRMRRPRQRVSDDIPLTKRELQVLQHVALGLSNREVGKSLGISVETAKEHVQNILRKLDVNDRTQAAVWAVKRGLA